ncbi:ABC transporter ATP-binding protein [Candidatus Jorgensenbacteria bacterium]|nr:ABC transporter ATP-binding protein [Candidatus Jorgensenbacteria bacterium]
MSGEQPIIELKNVNFTFDPGKVTEVRAINNVWISIQPGEYVAFFGPSGCGKTSLLYIIAGIEKPQSGEVLIDNKDISNFSPAELAIVRQTKIGIIFQNFNLISTITVLDNVALPMAFLGIPERERKERALALLKRFGLEHLAVRYPNELSGGQQQRVSIARSLANDPQIILADEPMGNLDTTNAEIVLDQLKELNQRDKKTIIMVTHEVWTLRDATKIFYLRDGKLIKTDERTKEEIPETPTKSIPPLLTVSLVAGEPTSKKIIENQPIGEQIIEKRELASTKSEVPIPTENKPIPPTEPTAIYEPSKTEPMVSKTTAAITTLYPELKGNDLKIRSATTVLMNGYNQETERRFETLLKQRLENKLNPNEFKNMLDQPWKSGGLGLWKRTAEKLALESEKIIGQQILIEQILKTLEHEPRVILSTECQVIRTWLLEDIKTQLKPVQIDRLDELIEEIIRGIISWTDFEKILTLPPSKYGVGFRGKTPYRLTGKFKLALTNLKNTTS